MGTPTLTSPNIDNLKIGRGYLKMKMSGDISFIDIGETLEMSFELQPTIAKFFSSRDGTQKQKASAVTRIEGTLTFSAMEHTVRVMQLAMLGNATDSGGHSVDAYTNPQFVVALQFTDTSDVGPQWGYVFPKVQIIPKNAFAMISKGSGDYDPVELSAQILFDDATQSFFTATSSSFA